MSQAALTPGQSRTRLMVLFTLFLVPYLLAWWAYQHPSWQRQHAHHGELLQPLISLKALRLTTPSGTKLYPTGRPRQWLLLYVQSSDCLQQCQRNLYHLRQIRLALGKDQGRVQRVFAAVHAPHIALLQHMKTDYRGTHLVHIDQQGLAELSNRNGLYLTDPDGHVFMHYAQNFRAKDVLKDMSRLLRLSQIG